MAIVKTNFVTVTIFFFIVCDLPKSTCFVIFSLVTYIVSYLLRYPSYFIRVISGPKKRNVQPSNQFENFGRVFGKIVDTRKRVSIVNVRMYFERYT